MLLWRVDPSRTQENARAGRLRRLLIEFLQKKCGPRPANVHEETGSQDSEIEVQNQVTLAHDLLFKIFVLLPAESLFRLQFVCKNWFSLINSSVFITCHAQHSETVLISRHLTVLEPGCHPLENEDRLKSYFHFLDLDLGDDNFVESSVAELVDIQASCDGLVLATRKRNESLVLMNLATRKHIALPLGAVDNFRNDLYGMAFCNEANTYKVVHLFCRARNTGCEILNISTRKWTRMECPDPEVLRYKRKIVVSVGGSLYWMLRMRNCDFFVSMNVQEEKLVPRKLPASCGPNDRLLEIGGSLGFVTHADPVDLLQVWVLINDGGSREDWIRRYIIKLSVDVPYPIPICSSRNGKELVLESLRHRVYIENLRHCVYVYDFDNGEMKLVHSKDDNQAWYGRIEQLYIPHRNTLTSWERRSS